MESNYKFHELKRGWKSDLAAISKILKIREIRS